MDPELYRKPPAGASVDSPLSIVDGEGPFDPPKEWQGTQCRFRDDTGSAKRGCPSTFDSDTDALT